MQTPDSDKLRSVLEASYRDLHAAGVYRHAWPPLHLARFRELLGGQALAARARVLDYGCGPDGGLAQDAGFNAVGYDPFVPEFSACEVLDWSYHAVYAADVLEHLTVEQLGDFFATVARIGPELVYLAIALRPATKHLCNGLNVHLTIEPLSWWQGFAQASLSGYAVVVAETDHKADSGVLALRRSA